MSRHLSALLTALCIAAPLAAQSVVVPAASANARSTTQLNSIIRNAANPRTYMIGVSSTELGAIPVGAVITGFSLRFQAHASNPPTWPAVDIVWPDYQIYAGPAIPFGTWTGNFMGNFTTTPVQVRGGPMTLPANSFTNTSPPAGVPNDWSEFYFDFQVPYTYTGGDLALLFSHPGSNDPALAPYPETVLSSAATYGVGYSQSSYPVGSGGAATTFYVHRIHYGYGAGCPGTGGFAPMFVLNQNTTGGGTALFTIQNAPANAPALYVIGIGQIPIPLFNGCTLHTVPIVTVPTSLDAAGRARLSLQIRTGVLGVIDLQCLVVDANGPQGLTTSNAVEFTAN